MFEIYFKKITGAEMWKVDLRSNIGETSWEAIMFVQEKGMDEGLDRR